jgi:hypothetical protein
MTNLLPIDYPRAGICYPTALRWTPTSSANRQMKSNNRQISILPVGRCLESTDNRPTFLRNQPMHWGSHQIPAITPPTVNLDFSDV